MQKFALGIFFHIEGAFDSTLCNALEWKIHRAVKNKYSNGEENGMC